MEQKFLSNKFYEGMFCRISVWIRSAGVAIIGGKKASIDRRVGGVWKELMNLKHLMSLEYLESVRYGLTRWTYSRQR